MEIKSLNSIKEMRNTIDNIREHIQEDGEIDRVLYDIYDNYIENIYSVILAGIDEGELYKEQAALFDEIVILRKILYFKYTG